METNWNTTGRNVDPSEFSREIEQPDLVTLIRNFLHDRLGPTEDYLPNSSHPGPPHFNSPISVYPSALATFRAPSDMYGTGNMCRERIRAVPSWRQGPARHDCVFVESNGGKGMRGLNVARVRLFFSFTFRGQSYPCALVHKYYRVGNDPDEVTGMWIVKAEKDVHGAPSAAVLHLDTVIRAAHLIGIYRTDTVPTGLTAEQSLDAFSAFYVNKFIDHHSFAIAF